MVGGIKIRSDAASGKKRGSLARGSDARRSIRESGAVTYASGGLNKREKLENLIPFETATE